MFAVLNGWPYPSNSQQKQPLSYAWFAIEAAPGVDSWIASGWLQYQCHSFIQRAGLPGILCREQLKTLGCRKSALGRTSGEELSSKNQLSLMVRVFPGKQVWSLRHGAP